MRWATGFAVGLLGLAAVVSCGGGGGGTGGSGGSGGNASTSTSTGGSSTGGSPNTGGGSSTGGSSTGGSSTGGGNTGGGGSNPGYTTCSECTDTTSGAPANECNAADDACAADAGCAAIYNCTYFGTGGVGPCDATQTGACCVLACYAALGSTQASIDLYEAADGCIYCQTCKTLCSTDPYCAVFEPGGDSVCEG